MVMKRWGSLLVLLLLVPLTLAPRTSWTLEEVEYDLTVATPRDAVRVNAAVPLTLRLLSRSDDVIEHALLVIDVAVDGRDAVDVVAASAGCTISGTRVTCDVADIPAHGTGEVRIVLRALQKGLVTVAVEDGVSGGRFGTATFEAVTPR